MAHPASYQGMYAVSTILPVLCSVAVGLRFMVRSRQNAKLQFDDWAQIPALIILIAMACIAIAGTEARAFGYPQPDWTPVGEAPETILVEKLWLAQQTIQIPGLTLVKLAALQFYRRIFVAGSGGILHTVIWILTVIVTLWGVAMVTFYLSSCGTHFSAAWSGIFGFLEHCRQTQNFNLSYAISNFLLDTFILIVPLPSIWRLQTNLTRKVLITGVFLLALIGYGASTARMVAYVRLVTSTLAPPPPDVNSQDTEALWYSMLELGFSIIALNLPSLWGMFSSLSIDNLANSIRSVFSLGSNSRSNVTRSYKGTPKAASPTASKQSLTSHSNDQEYPLADVEPINGSRTYRDDIERGINVQKTVEVSRE